MGVATPMVVSALSWSWTGLAEALTCALLSSYYATGRCLYKKYLSHLAKRDLNVKTFKDGSVEARSQCEDF